MITGLLHKIRKTEVKKAAAALSEAFADYPLFRTMFPTKNEKKYKQKLFGSFLFWLYTMFDSFYCDDEVSVVACIETPEDKNPNEILALLKHPWFLIRGVFHDFSIKDFLMIGRNIDISEKYAKKYKQDGDYYFHLLCTTSKARASTTIFKLLMQSCENTAIFCETYTTKNVSLYKCLGFEVLEEVPWYGLTHYVMRREKSAR